MNNNTTNSKEVINAAIKEIIESMAEIEAQQQHIKDITKMLKESFDISPAVSKKAAKLIHDDKVQSYIEKEEHFIEFISSNR